MVHTTNNQKQILGPKFNIFLTIASLSGILVIIFASNLDFFCIPKHSRPFNISNEELFLIYSIIFAGISIFLLKLSSGLKHKKFIK